MINHARTLLLNKTSNTLALAGDAEITSADFAPVILSSQLTTIRTALFGIGTTVTDELKLAESYMSLLHTPELEGYTLLFDTRITYVRDRDITIGDMCRTSYSPKEQFNDALNALATIVPNESAWLFTWPKYQTYMTQLSKMWYNNFDSVLKLGSLVLAYVYQVEALRQKR